MADEKLLDLIPASIRPQLIQEVKDMIAQENNQQSGSKGVDPVFTQKINVKQSEADPAVAAFAKSQNQKSKNQK